jgi:flagellar protein FlbD
MISLTRLNGERIALNPELIERAEETPDTVLTLVNGTKYVVHESLDEVVELFRLHRAAILALSNDLTVRSSGVMTVEAATRPPVDVPPPAAHLQLLRGEDTGGDAEHPAGHEPHPHHPGEAGR